LPIDTDIVEVLENTLFSELLYKMNKEGFDVLSPEQIKDEYVKEYLNDHGISQEFEQGHLIGPCTGDDACGGSVS
jgi:hypothetical protein